jgi:hypothetical protein
MEEQLDPRLLMRILNAITGTAEDIRGVHSELGAKVILHQIRDACLGGTTTYYSDLDEKYYLQAIRDAILRVTPTARGDMDECVYLQQIRDAILGTTTTQYGDLSKNEYLEEIYNAILTIQSTLVLNFAAYPDGILPFPLVGGTWAMLGGKAVNTPTLGLEMLSNGNMEVITGWVDNGSSVVFQRSNEKAHTGTYSLKDISDAVNEGPIQNKAIVQWAWYSITGYVWLTSGSFRLGDENGRIVNPQTIAAPTGSWIKMIHTGWASVAGNAFVGAVSRTAASQFYLDDITWKRITESTLAASAVFSSSNVIARMTATIAPNAWIGIWICQDAAKLNGIVACHNGAQVALLKQVNGVWSELIAPTVAAIGTGIEVRKSGTTVKLFCNGIQISTDKTVNDLSIVNNKIHGPMSTHPDNQLLTFSVLPN